LDARYEHLRHAALHARGDAFPLGFAVLTRRGVTAWRAMRWPRLLPRLRNDTPAAGGGAAAATRPPAATAALPAA